MRGENINTLEMERSLINLFEGCLNYFFKPKETKYFGRKIRQYMGNKKTRNIILVIYVNSTNIVKTVLVRTLRIIIFNWS